MSSWAAYRLIINFVYHIEGYVSRITVLYCLFKSLPVNEHLLLPTITPSGFNIGTSLNINFSRSSLAGPESLVKKSRNPFIIHDEGVSPGWTLPVITIARFFYKILIIIKSKEFLIKVLDTLLSPGLWGDVIVM